MKDVIGLLGLRYEQLASSNVLRGVELPELERIEDRSYLSVLSSGISFVFLDNETVGAIQLHAQDHEDFIGYAEPLPENLSFNMSRAEVRRLLGEPNQHGEEQEVIFLGKKPAWDAFLIDDVKIHLEYNFSESQIQLITITRN